MRITFEAPLRPTEDPERVAAAVTRFLPGSQAESIAGGLRASGTDADALRDRIWELRIIDAVRGRLLRGVDGPRVVTSLSKQAAYQGRVAVPASERAPPLGELRLEVVIDEDDPWPDAEAWVWWLCPATKDGAIVGPVDPDAP